MASQFRKLTCFMLLMLVLSITFACQLPSFLEDTRPVTISSSEGQYEIDSVTILASIDQGNADVFISQIGTPEVMPTTPGKPVQWSQADYYRIAQTLHEFVWGEPIENWNLSEILFRMGCEDANNGPQFAQFQLFRIGHVDEQETRIVRSLFIEPMKQSVSWHEYETAPAVGQWPTIDLGQFGISANDALQIAESNDGSKERSTVNNECSIYITAPDSMYDGWRIDYSQTNLPPLFEIHIDPMTGEYKVVTPDK